VVNLHHHKDKDSVGAVMRYLTERAPTDIARQQVAAAMEGELGPVGLLLHERLIPLPPILETPLHHALFRALTEACDRDIQEDRPPAFRFEYYLLLANTYNEAVAQDPKQPKQKKAKSGEETFFYKEEEEFYQKESKWFFTFAVSRNEMSSRWTFGGMMAESRSVILIHHSKIPSILQQIEENFAEKH